MEYREYGPPPDLAPFVRSFWTLCGTAAPGATERILPDGRLELVVHLGDPFRQQRRALFVGQQDSHVLLQPAGFTSVFGICFHPDGASAFAPWPQHETAGRIVPLEDLWGAPARGFEEQLRNAPATAQRIAIAHSFLRRRIQPPGDCRLRVAVDLIQREPWRRMSDVAAYAGFSTRHLERAFLNRVGCTPKTLSCIARFQRMMSLREHRPGWSWARVAAESGYYDQAHLIADFRRFAGSTPAFHQDDLTRMERLFLRMSHFSNPAPTRSE